VGEQNGRKCLVLGFWELVLGPWVGGGVYLKKCRGDFGCEGGGQICLGAPPRLCTFVLVGLGYYGGWVCEGGGCICCGGGGALLVLGGLASGGAFGGGLEVGGVRVEAGCGGLGRAAGCGLGVW